MTTPDAKLPKALWLDKTRFEHRMKTDPDADKLRAALPEQIKVSLDRSERFEPVTPYLVCAITERLDMEKEAGRKWPFHAGWHEAHECVKAAKEFVNTYKYTQTVDAHSEQFVAQNKINEGVQQDLSFNAGEHNALKGRVQRTEQDVGKLEGEQGMAKNVIDTMRERDAAMAHQQSEKDREWRQEIREAAKWENQANAKKMEADAMEQDRDEWKAKCEATVAQKEVGCRGAGGSTRDLRQQGPRLVGAR